MPTYNSSLTKLAQVGKPAYSFGFDNTAPLPAGPAAPSTPVLTGTVTANANIAGTVFVATQFVYPGSPSVVDPQRLPGGFVSATSNVTVTTGNAVVVTSPGSSPDVGNIAIGYNVYAGYVTPLTLVNNLVIPTANNYSISSNVQLSGTANVLTGVSSPTHTYTGEKLTSASSVAGVAFAIPLSGMNYTGGTTIGWRSAFANATPSAVNVAIQVASIDNANSYVTVDYSTSTTGDYRVINPVNAKFVRATANVTGTNVLTSVSIQAN